MILTSEFASYDGNTYKVQLNNYSGTSTGTFTLAANAPFVITYDQSNTPFEPMRLSEASIRVVSDDSCNGSAFSDSYFLDFIKSDPQGTSCTIYKEGTTDELIWAGYLTSNLLNQNYEDNVFELELNAIDALSTLQYKKYTTYNSSKKQLVSFKNIFQRACDACGLTRGFCLTNGTKRIGNANIDLSLMTISEQNFFYTDTNEAWNWSEVLEECCKYLGVTMIQIGDILYLIDYNAFKTKTTLDFDSYIKPQYTKTTSHGPATIQLNSSTLRETGHNISFEQIYDRMSVKDSFYDVDDFIPDIFDENYLTNRNSENILAYQYNPPYSEKIKIYNDIGNVKDEKTCARPVYFDDKGKQQYDDDDENHYFYRRVFDHDWYQSKYYDENINPVTLSESQLKSSACTRDYIGGTVYDNGSVERNLIGSGYTEQERSEWEVASSLDFDRYILLSTLDRPGYAASASTLNVMAPQQNLSYYSTPLFQLKSGFTQPIVLDSDNMFLVLNAKAIWERYHKRDYINPEWSEEGIDKFATRLNFNSQLASNPYGPTLTFKLGIGNKWFNGRGWQSGETAFYVELAGTWDDKGNNRTHDYWNKELGVLNSVDWTMWSSESGYYIPLSQGLDLSQDIHFAVCFPSRSQEGFAYFDPILGANKVLEHSGLNNYVWLSELTLKLHQRGEERPELYKTIDGTSSADIVYEELINEVSVNSLPEVDLKVTSNNPNGKPSYSTVGYNGSYVTGITETAIDGMPHLPEENICKKYVAWYNTPTIKLEMNVGNDKSQIAKYRDIWSGKYYCVLGTTIDIKENLQTLSLIEIKN